MINAIRLPGVGDVLSELFSSLCQREQLSMGRFFGFGMVASVVDRVHDPEYRHH